MFNKTYITPGSGHVSADVRVEERRAPTDESVRLLSEMERAARDRVEQSWRVADNGFDATITAHVDNITDRIIFVAVYSLNGRPMRSEAHLERRKQPSVQQIVEIISEAIAKDVSKEIVHSAIHPVLVAYTK